MDCPVCKDRTANEKYWEEIYKTIPLTEEEIEEGKMFWDEFKRIDKLLRTEYAKYPVDEWNDNLASIKKYADECLEKVLPKKARGGINVL